jgi:tRNA(adenine34) deaminase
MPRDEEMGCPSLFSLYDLMRMALEEAEKGLLSGEVPVGAVLAGEGGEVLAKAHNRPISLRDPSAHAEILAMREAGRSLNNYRLNKATLVVTIEPCIMCMGAAVHARVGRVVFGAHDPKAGAAGSLYNFGTDTRLNHCIEVIPGILEEECRDLMQRFFRMRREEGPVIARRGLLLPPSASSQ